MRLFLNLLSTYSIGLPIAIGREKKKE